MARSALGLDDYAEGLIWLLVGYVVLNYLRNASVTDQGELVFPGDEPSQDIIGDAVDILSPMQVSPTGAAFIKNEEGLTLVRKPDAKGGSQIGYGHYFPPGTQAPARITKQQAEDYFTGDLATAAQAVNNSLTVQVTQNQFDALASLAFNIGAGAFANSTMVKDLNAGAFNAASDQFLAWAKNHDLAARRQREQNVFDGGTGAMS